MLVNLIVVEVVFSGSKSFLVRYFKESQNRIGLGGALAMLLLISLLGGVFVILYTIHEKKLPKDETFWYDD